jgi:hypothetical protein
MARLARNLPASGLHRRRWSGALAGLLLGMGLAGATWAEPVRLDTHTKTLPPLALPEQWQARKIDPIFGSGEIYFFQFVNNGPDEQYIHLRSGRNNSFSVGHELRFRLQQYPELSWEWRITQLPKDGDVRILEQDDQAGSMCVIVDPGLIGFKSLCYIWENDGPIDLPLTSRKRDDSKYIILRTGKAPPFGDWVAERRNMLQDYQLAFGEAPKEEAIIGMQIDSNSTRSVSEAFYRRIVLYRAK